MLSVANTAVDNRVSQSHYSEPDDGELDIQRALIAVGQHQHKQSFELLFKHFAPKIRGFGLQRFGQEALALELVQDTLLLVWRKAALFNADKGKASTWIYTVMRNHCFDMLRKQQTQKEDQVSDDLWPLIESQPTEADHLLSSHLLTHINCLPTQQREIIEALYHQELSQQEVASKLGIPIGTVKSRLRLAITKLKTKLEIDHD
jgi:RNA polymerase sigma-70 factor (ECF subfamily)